MALWRSSGPPLAHEDHAVRAGYAALAMQESVTRYGDALQRSQGVPIQIRVGLNSWGSRRAGDWQRPAYGLHRRRADDAPRRPHGADGQAWLDPDHDRDARLAEGYIRATALGPVPVKGLDAPVEVFRAGGRQWHPAALAGDRGPRAHPLCRPRYRVRGSGAGPGAGWGRTRAGSGRGRRGRGG